MNSLYIQRVLVPRDMKLPLRFVDESPLNMSNYFLAQKTHFGLSK
jgi:hypothetical protein